MLFADEKKFSDTLDDLFAPHHYEHQRTVPIYSGDGLEHYDIHDDMYVKF